MPSGELPGRNRVPTFCFQLEIYRTNKRASFSETEMPGDAESPAAAAICVAMRNSRKIFKKEKRKKK